MVFLHGASSKSGPNGRTTGMLFAIFRSVHIASRVGGYLFITNIIFSGLASFAWASGAYAASDVAITSKSSLQFASDVPFFQRELLTSDIELLTKIQLKKPSASLGPVMDLQGLPTADGLLDWLFERVQYIVTARFTTDETNTFIEQRKYSFENPDVFPPNPLFQQQEVKEIPDGARMANVGSLIYAASKKRQQLWKVRIPGIGKDLVIESPRIGIVAIGPALFKTDKSREEQKSLFYRFERLTTLFHEGRHSDGNGVTQGLAHSYCPRGHAFENALACDKNLNGPYSVGASVAKTFAENCEKCSRLEKELLLLVALDSQSRVLTETVTYTDQDRWEIENLEEIKEKCLVEIYGGAKVKPASEECKAIDEKIELAKAGARNERALSHLNL